MHRLRFRFVKLLAIVIAFSVFYAIASPTFLNPTSAFAVGDLNINWGVPSGDPIFKVLDFKPCDVETRTVTVKNTDNSPKPVAVVGTKTLETDTITGVIDFKISSNGTDIYGGTTGAKTLAQFFTDSAIPGGIPLATLSPNQTKSFNFTATFKCASGNEYQQKKVIFDLKIGVLIKIDPCDNKEDEDHDRDHKDKKDDKKSDKDDKNHYQLIFEKEKDYRDHHKDDCPKPSPTPKPTPSPKVSPTPSPRPTLTPTPTPKPHDDKHDDHKDNHHWWDNFKWWN